MADGADQQLRQQTKEIRDGNKVAREALVGTAAQQRAALAAFYARERAAGQRP